MDAQVSYEFHSERKRNPEKFKNQLTNQVYLHFVFILNTNIFHFLDCLFRFATPSIHLVFYGSYNAFL